MTKDDFRIDKIMDGTFRITRIDVEGDLHTHVKSKKMAYQIIDNVISNKIPHHLHYYTLVSMWRLSTDENFKNKIDDLLTVRKGKTHQVYFNSNKVGKN